jgi:hypothetical protein
MMAIIKQSGLINDVVRYEISYDDATMKLESIHIENAAKTRVHVEIDEYKYTTEKETTEDKDTSLATAKQWRFETIIKDGKEKQTIMGIPWSIRRGEISSTLIEDKG